MALFNCRTFDDEKIILFKSLSPQTKKKKKPRILEYLCHMCILEYLQLKGVKYGCGFKNERRYIYMCTYICMCTYKPLNALENSKLKPNLICMFILLHTSIKFNCLGKHSELLNSVCAYNINPYIWNYSRKYMVYMIGVFFFFKITLYFIP